MKALLVSFLEKFNTHLFTYYTHNPSLCCNLCLKIKHLQCLKLRTKILNADLGNDFTKNSPVQIAEKKTLHTLFSAKHKERVKLSEDRR